MSYITANSANRFFLRHTERSVPSALTTILFSTLHINYPISASRNAIVITRLSDRIPSVSAPGWYTLTPIYEWPPPDYFLPDTLELLTRHADSIDDLGQ